MHVAFENETETLVLTRSPGTEREAVSKTNGQSSPLGATVRADGVNFSVYSRNASSIELLLFERVDDAKPARVIDIDSVTNRTYHYWHVFVPETQAGQIYAYRVHGTFDPAKRNAIRSREGSARPLRPRRCRSRETTVVARPVRRATTPPQP